MKKISQPIVFFGTEEFSAKSLQALIDEKLGISLVITKPDSKRGRGKKMTAPLVKEIALKNNIEVLQPQKLAEIIPRLEELSQPVGILASYGKIIPKAIIDIFSPGIINVHPSLLPLYRGPSPIESALLHGDKETGISIMQLSEAMDAGPVYSQKVIPLNGQENRLELYDTLSLEGASELVRTLPGILSGDIKPQAQDTSQATYCELLSKSQSYLAPTTMTAEEMERHVRAFLGFPRSRCMLFGHEVVVTKAHLDTEKTNTLPQLVGTDGIFLSIDQLIGPSGKTMSGDAFLRGYVKD